MDIQKANKANKANVRSQNHQKVMRKSKKTKTTNSANQPGGTPPPLNLAFAVPVQKTSKLAPTPPLVDGSGLVLGVFFMVLIRLHEECHQNSKIQADVCQIVFAKVWNCWIMWLQTTKTSWEFWHSGFTFAIFLWCFSVLISINSTVPHFCQNDLANTSSKLAVLVTLLMQFTQKYKK